ncbi:MAG TPA: prepilin peptidase [Vicinamibacteria bacterium]|nr:prepilin peptidase [Vicinamibacteria bacterium]
MAGSSSSFISWLGPGFAFSFGLVWGSFVNVVIHRLPRGKFLDSTRSRCPACGEIVAAYDNVPVLSFLFLGGRCRYCKARISFRYPVVELAVGCASLLAYLRHGPTLECVVELAFVAATVALVFIDYEHQILPNSITIPGILAGLALSLLRDTISIRDSALGALLGAGLLFVVAELYFRLRGIEGLGFGDVKMMGMVGAFLGWKGVFLTLFLGSFAGSVVGGFVLARGGDMQTKLPFGTFLGAGAIVALYSGTRLIGWYSGLF